MSRAKCPRCGEINLPGVTTCWTCGQTGLRTDSAVPAREVEPRDPLNEYGTLFVITGAVLLAAGATVCLGVLMEAPGIAIILAIVTVPAFVRTGLVVRRRSQLGKPVSQEKRIWLLMGSLVASMTVAVVVGLASVGTFCAVCLASEYRGTLPISLLIGTVCFGALVWMVVLNWKQWRRDVWDE